METFGLMVSEISNFKSENRVAVNENGILVSTN